MRFDRTSGRSPAEGMAASLWWINGMRNSALFAVAIGLLTFVLGFSFGDLFGARYDFHLNEWQGLAGTLVAIVAAGIAYIGVWTTQRVSVMTREEGRIDRMLPGLRQTYDLLDLLVEQTDLPERLRYVAHQAVRGVIRPQDGENYETIVSRTVPLAEPELRREVTAAVFRLSTQAGMLKVMHDEIERTQRDLADLETFAPNYHDAVRRKAEDTLKANEREVGTFISILESVKRLRTGVADRIKETEARRKIIRRVIDKYFKQE